jgi:hypothetical protein
LEQKQEPEKEHVFCDKRGRGTAVGTVSATAVRTGVGVQREQKQKQETLLHKTKSYCSRDPIKGRSKNRSLQ